MLTPEVTETSNRAKTNDRAKLKHKVKESRKKKAKAAKKNPQWKSSTLFALLPTNEVDERLRT